MILIGWLIDSINRPIFYHEHVDLIRLAFPYGRVRPKRPCTLLTRERRGGGDFCPPSPGHAQGGGWKLVALTVDDGIPWHNDSPISLFLVPIPSSSFAQPKGVCSLDEFLIHHSASEHACVCLSLSWLIKENSVAVFGSISWHFFSMAELRQSKCSKKNLWTEIFVSGNEWKALRATQIDLSSLLEKL